MIKKILPPSEPHTAPRLLPQGEMASPRQLARLRFLRVPFEEPLTSKGAEALIDATKDHPEFALRVQQWRTQKYELHPDLYRLGDEPADADGGGRSEPVFDDDHLIVRLGGWFRRISYAAAALLICFVAGYFVLGKVRRTELQHAASHTAPAGSLLWPSRPIDAPAPVVKPGSETAIPPVGNLSPKEYAAQVAASKQAALARYPDLGVANSEINIRFGYRYKLMVNDRSPRLLDPSWPVILADECATASVAHGKTGAPANHAASRPAVAERRAPAPSPSVAPVIASAPAPTPAPAVQLSAAPASAAAHTLAFHPVGTVGALSSTPLPPPAQPNPEHKTANPLPFITMEAVNQHSGNDYTYNWLSSWGWYDISFRQSVGLHVDLRNMSRTPATLNLRWVFFARRGSSSQRFVFAAESKSVDLGPGQLASYPIDSPMIQSRDVVYTNLGERYLAGSKYEGWLVQVTDRDSGQVIKQIGSTSYLEDLAKRTDYSALIADYSKTVGPRSGSVVTR